jgi:hypothetical protein
MFNLITSIKPFNIYKYFPCLSLSFYKILFFQNLLSLTSFKMNIDILMIKQVNRIK